MFSNIKNFFLNRYISGNKSPKNPRITNLKQAKFIALLCEITDEDSYKDIFRLFTQLQNEGHQVKLVGYVNDKEVPFYCLPQLSADYFCNKHLNWFGLPNFVQIQDFLKEDYDMLIDFNTVKYAPIQAILALTHSKFIIGREPQSQSLYDLFMDDGKSSNDHFLEVIHDYTLKLTGNDR